MADLLLSPQCTKQDAFQITTVFGALSVDLLVSRLETGFSSPTARQHF